MIKKNEGERGRREGELRRKSDGGKAKKEDKTLV